MKKIMITLMLIGAAAGAAKAETVMIDFNGNRGSIYAEDLAEGQEVVKATTAVAGVKAAASAQAVSPAVSAGASSSVSKPQAAVAALPAAVSAAKPSAPSATADSAAKKS